MASINPGVYTFYNGKGGEEWNLNKEKLGPIREDIQSAVDRCANKNIGSTEIYRSTGVGRTQLCRIVGRISWRGKNGKEHLQEYIEKTQLENLRECFWNNLEVEDIRALSKLFPDGVVMDLQKKIPKNIKEISEKEPCEPILPVTNVSTHGPSKEIKRAYTPRSRIPFLKIPEELRLAFIKTVEEEKAKGETYRSLGKSIGLPAQRVDLIAKGNLKTFKGGPEGEDKIKKMRAFVDKKTSPNHIFSKDPKGTPMENVVQEQQKQHPESNNKKRKLAAVKQRLEAEKQTLEAKQQTLEAIKQTLKAELLEKLEAELLELEYAEEIATIPWNPDELKSDGFGENDLGSQFPDFMIVEKE